MEKIRISDKLKMFIVHPYTGRHPVPIDRIEWEDFRDGNKYPVLHFTKIGDGYSEKMSLGMAFAIRRIEEHVQEQNVGAEAQAAERGSERPDRYVVRDMCVEEVLWYEDGVVLHCSWNDCYGFQRGYSGMHNKVSASHGDKNKLWIHGERPRFYF